MLKGSVVPIQYNVKKQMKRIEGQVREILPMMEEETECQDIVSQLAVIRKAIDRLIAVIVSANVDICVRKQFRKNDETDNPTQEAINLLIKSQ